MAQITKRGKAYRISVCIGRDYQDKRIMKTTTYHPTSTTEKQIKKEVELFALKFEEEVRNDQFSDGKKITFGQFVKIWDEQYSKVQNSIAVNENQLRNLQKYGHNIYNMKLIDIKAYNMQALVNELEKSGKAPVTIRNIFYAFSSVLTYAYKMNIVSENVCRRVILPTGRARDDIKYFTLDQAKRFLNEALEMENITIHKEHIRTLAKFGKTYDVPTYIESHRIKTQYKAFFSLAIYGGFRKGEILALTWNDIDTDNMKVNITKAVSNTKNGVIIKTPKTRAGKRSVSLPKECFDHLQKWKTEQIQICMKLGSAWKGCRGSDFNNNHIFIRYDGSLMGIDTPYFAFKRIIRLYNEKVEDPELKLPNITLHDLRHTSATLLISEGVDVEVIAKRLGHERASLTLDVYGHALETKDQIASDTLSKMLSV